MDSKARFIKIRSSTDRTLGTLNSFSVDLTDISYLQNVTSVQLVSAGFVNTNPNVGEFENTLVVQKTESGQTITSIYGVEPGVYTTAELVTTLNDIGGITFEVNSDGKVVASDSDAFTILTVIQNRQSTLAPLLGFHYPHEEAASHTADTVPGLTGITEAFIHIRPIASLAGVAVSSRDGRALQVSIMGAIPLAAVPFGTYTEHDFSKSGDTFTISYENPRDISRFQVRLRDHAGNLIEIPNPGLVLLLKCTLQ
jgi:hypothetical protein